MNAKPRQHPAGSVESLGERIARLLVQEGVDRFFSLPEVTFGKLHHKLDDLGCKLIAPHHETVGGYMAEAYAQMTGNIAVTGANSGPGVMNLYPAVANSYAENLPVLYLGSERTLLARNSPRTSQFQQVPNTDVLTPITKFRAILEDPLEADTLFQEAFRQMHTGRPGPCYIGLPFDLLLEEREFGPLIPPERYRPATFLDLVSEADLSRIADTLANARRPLIIGGSGIRLSRAQEAFRAFVESLGAPVMLTVGGRGALPDTHPQVLRLGEGPGDRIAREADVIITLGSSIGEKTGFGGNPYVRSQTGFPQYFGPEGSQHWIQVDRDPAAIGRNRPVDDALLGDVARVLPRLTGAIAERRPQLDRAATHTAKTEHETYLAELGQAATGQSPLHPGKLVLEVQKALPKDVIWVRDGGATSVWQMNLLNHEISDELTAMKHGNLGTGLPYAMGAAIAARDDDRHVVLFTGDGAFGFYLMEFETAVRYELPIVIVVAYDAGWSLELPYYMHVCGRTFEIDHRQMRLDEIARQMGGHGEYCDKPDEIVPAVERALASGKPAIIQAHIDRDINAYQMPNTHIWSRWHADKAVYSSD
ncbi:thiamine pyrophosphate-binding protein [Sagittula sp. NFXS13]|uniref:thiamine pyrophosphate-binding protein n=1 Tax=Sagittula sp. NFXS13 TaxID=2819095 RepID=UPI0032E036B3